MDYDTNDEEDCPSPEGSLFDDVNAEKFAQQYAEMEEDELNDLENNPKKPLSDVLPKEFSFKTSQEDEGDPVYSTALELQQANHGHRREATADSSYAEDQSSRSARVPNK